MQPAQLESRPPAADKFGRSFRTLRLSVTSQCDLACQYCVDDNGRGRHLPGSLAAQEFVQLVAAVHAVNPLSVVRLTGGEPLLYPRVVDLVHELKNLGIERVSMTTNARLLSKHAAELSTAGLDSINVSLDAVDEDVFATISRRRSLHRVLEGVDAALASKLKVKLNSTIMRGVNHSQVVPLFEYAGEKGITIRYLELMKMGHLHDSQNEQFYSESEILEQIGARQKFEALPRAASSTARYWRTENDQTFGVIANESHPFCRDCDRLRLDSRGRFYGCLSVNQGFEAVGLSGEEIVQTLQLAMAQKQDERFTGSSISMLEIGG